MTHVEEYGGLGAGHPDIFDAFHKRTRERLAAEAKRLRSLCATVRQKLLSGAPYEALGETATTSDARLVVVASIGRVAPSRLLAGSVAERTAETSPVPTLVVRDGAPLMSWARGERRLNVLVGRDFSASADAALRWLR
jgi:nucleotide-binding universal stress UspA family protein